MEPNSVQWVGSPCGSHGPYVFYKAFQFQLGARARILSLGDFFFVRCKPGDPICIAELQLLWEERTSRQLFSSSKLYFLPEDTPQGRSSDHGEDEVIAASEKVTVKLEDLARWARADISKWQQGIRAEALRLAELRKTSGQREALSRFRQSTHNSGLNFKDILKEKADLGEEDEDANVLILSYPQYCRYRSMLKRVQGKPSSVLADQCVLALGGIAVISRRPQILYCRDTFDHPTLIDNESVCDEFAPNLKGRPRKKKPQRRDSLSGTKESHHDCEARAVAKVKCESKSSLSKTKNNNINCKKGSDEAKSKGSVGEECRADEQAFLVALYKYMKERKTPIERIPYLGFKQINLWTMFQAAQKLGGYETITAHRQWKHIYDELGGNPGSTSAATCTRRHYERLILPYERYIKGEEDKPLPLGKPRKQDATQEVESKIKLSGAKRIRNETLKSKRERDDGQRAQEVSPEKEKTQESPVQESCFDAAEATPLPVQGVQSLPAAPGVTPFGKTCGKEVAPSEEELLSGASCPLVPPEENVVLTATIRKLPSPLGDPEEAQREQRADGLEKEAHALPFSSFPTLQLPLPGQNEMEDDKLPAMADYIANCTVKVDQLGHEDIRNALKQSPRVLVVQNFDMFKEKEAACSFDGEPTFGCTPLLYAKGHPGIMSPLAKKKLLSQVSGAALSYGYPYGSPPPLISKKKPARRDDASTGPPALSRAHAGEGAAVSRPSVIQHVPSTKPKAAEERKPASDALRPDSLLKKPDPESCNFSKQQHLSALAESYALKSEIQDMKERMSEKRAPHPSHMPGFLADLYCPPHLHGLYRHTEHRLHQERLLPQDLYPENLAGFPQAQDKRLRSYHPALHPPENRSPTEASSEDQPTDLSLPKGLPRLMARAQAAPLLRASAQQDSKSPSQLCSLGSRLRLEGSPKACCLSPMAVAATKKHGGDSLLRPSKPPASRKVDRGAHPALSPRTMVQSVGAVHPLKRSLEESDPVGSEKKTRTVSPLRFPKAGPLKEGALEPEGEGSRAAHCPPPGGVPEGHKFPLSSPLLAGLYPGTLCSRLGHRPPAGSSHPLQYLKTQTVLSPLVQPLAVHSFMVQRQFLASPGGSQQLYRHLAAATPVGSSYGDLLHSPLYPLAAINPQSAFPGSPLSSGHPSTKL